MNTAPALARAQLSLDGLSVGDAFGELYMSLYPRLSRASSLPAGPWLWTDDTHMALSVVQTLRTCGRIDQDVLASAFARRYKREPYRGYAGGAARLLHAIDAGADWRDVSPKLFGAGSYGNGAAMRAAPIGGYYGGDPGRAAQEAQLSAVVTHWHPEGQAGAMAVAVAAAIAAGAAPPSGAEFVLQVSTFLPASLTKDRVLEAVNIPPDQPVDAIRRLGTGQQVSAQDTVPFCLWVAAHNVHDFKEALWCTVEGMGDADTTCAIVGGIVALSAQEIPADWIARREPLPPL